MRTKAEIILEFANAMFSADLDYIASQGRFTPRMDSLWFEYVDVCAKEALDGRPKE
jgi:hypothetical protein